MAHAEAKQIADIAEHETKRVFRHRRRIAARLIDDGDTRCGTGCDVDCVVPCTT